MENEILDARIFYYSLFSKFFVFSYESDRFEGVKEALNLLLNYAIDEKSAISLKNLAENFDEELLITEYDDIFHSPPSPVRTTVSYYNEGYESSLSCLEIKKILAKTKFRKDSVKFIENEDNFGFLFVLMSEFIKFGKLEDKNYLEYAKEIFTKFLNPFIDEFIGAIYIHKSSNYYKDVVNLLMSFVELERVFYGTSKPILHKEIKVKNNLSRSEKIRREVNKLKRSRGSRDGF